MSLSRDMLARLCPRPRTRSKREIWQSYMDALTSPECAKLFNKYGITSRKRLVHLLAQWAHESGRFTIIWESGAYRYSTIKNIFGVGRHSARITDSEARRIASLPVEKRTKVLFERAYGSGNPKKAKELGNTEEGDGWRYRGCGIVQLTGKRDHASAAKRIGCKIDEIEQPINGIHAALLEWTDKNLNPLADKGDIRQITRRINGGYNGYTDRKNMLAKAEKIVPSDWELIVPVGDAKPEKVKEKPEVVPPRLEPVPPEVVKQTSKKLRVGTWLQRVSLAIGAFFTAISEWVSHALATIAGLLTLPNVQFAKEWVSELKESVSAWAIGLIAGGALVVYIYSKWIEREAIQDNQEGRYEPSGLAPKAD